MFEKCCISLSDFGFPVGKSDLQMIIKNFLLRIGRTVSCFKDNTPRDDWVRIFLKKHPSLTVRFATNLKRSAAAVNKDTLTEYISNLSVELNGVPPTHIWNFDETNLSDDPGNKKCIMKKGTKYPELIRMNQKPQCQ